MAPPQREGGGGYHTGTSLHLGCFQVRVKPQSYAGRSGRRRYIFVLASIYIKTGSEAPATPHAERHVPGSERVD